MRMLSVHEDSQHFFQELAIAKRRVLLLDYDSVIAPLSIASSAALPYPTVSELLDCIMTTSRTRVVFITARRASDLLPPVPGPIPDVWGAEECEFAGDHWCDTVPSLTTSLDDLLGTILTDGGEDTAVAYVSEGHGLYAAVREARTPDDDAGAFRGTLNQDPRQENFVQFLVDWLRVCGGEIC